MAYDAILLDNLSVRPVSIAPERSDDFRRFERLVVLAGASALGALLGFAIAMTLGHADLITMIGIAAPVLIAALFLTSEMLRAGLNRRAYGCAASAALHATALIAWPMTALLTPMSPMMFWIAPSMALTALVMLSSCWQGSTGGVYRVGAMGLMVAGLAAQQATMLALGA